MRTNTRLALLTLASASLSPATSAQHDGGIFAEPVLVRAGQKPLGGGRLYPSPVCHDINADGLLDVVVGDLRGHLTFALRLPGDETRYGNEQKLMDAEGKVLDFGNW